LTIDKSKVAFRAGRGKKIFYLVFFLLALVAAGFLYRMGFFTPPIQVQLANVTQIYPSQGFTVLTASGYVVPRRKSALASKVTGRLVWLGVEEGSRVKKDDVVARLESQDVEAAKALAAAIFLTLHLFLRISYPAGILMVPYLLWVGYAAGLNFPIYLLNC
jgi:multidrug efflux pump subunit AcrA (membrane-fusion protein)